MHVAASAVHGLVHLAIPVHVHGWQYGYAVAVVVAAPVVGVALLVRGRDTAGATLLLLSGVAALAFEARYHFVVANPDNVAAVESHRVLFGATATLTTAGDVALVAGAAWFLVRSLAVRRNGIGTGVERP